MTTTDDDKRSARSRVRALERLLKMSVVPLSFFVGMDAERTSSRERRNKKMENERSRRWQLTENNADYTKEQGAERLASIGQAIYVVSCEECGERGTKHIHAFVIFQNAISLNSLRKAFPRAHFETCKGTNVQNRAYIVKDDSAFYESGSMPITSEKERKRDEASEVIKLLNDGVPLIAISREYPPLADYVVRNYRSLKEIENDLGFYRKRR